jgi:amidase
VIFHDAEIGMFIGFAHNIFIQIIYPADRNAVVGIKPTVGLTSTKGIIPESSSLDTVGTLGRTVFDAAIALDGIVGGFGPGKSQVPRESHYLS